MDQSRGVGIAGRTVQAALAIAIAAPPKADRTL